MWYKYKDFATSKTKRTRGRFIGWTAKTGPLNARYAIFKRPCSDLLVPEYLLAAETKTAIKAVEAYPRQPL